MHFRLDPDPEYWEGKRGACVGALYAVISDSVLGVPPNGLIDICDLLNESRNPQAESIMKIIRRFSNTSRERHVRIIYM